MICINGGPRIHLHGRSDYTFEECQVEMIDDTTQSNRVRFVACKAWYCLWGSKFDTQHCKLSKYITKLY
jgi:hypothetical protein